MQKDAWFPLHHEIISGIKVGRILHLGNNYQILDASGKVKKILVAMPLLADFWMDNKFTEIDSERVIHFGGSKYYYVTSDERVIAPLDACPMPGDKDEALGFAYAMRRARDRNATISFVGSIYYEKMAILLPVPGCEETLTDDVLLGSYLTGGVRVSCHTERRLFSLVPWLTPDNLDTICRAANLGKSITHGDDKTEPVGKEKKAFQLVGRPDLELFFRDNVIDIIENEERYKALGIDFPGAIVLHGPPGCGKTFAIDALVNYLDWPLFTVDSGSVGSPYIHETGRKVSQIFDNATQKAPSVIVIDEMESYLADRERGGGHRIEEVAEFLRRIPEASKDRVLVIGMTNRIDTIDAAILRRGRFDHVIEVSMPSSQEVEVLLNKLFSERPCEDLSLDEVVRFLTGRPLSDVAFLVQESARLAAKSGKLRIDNMCLSQALNEMKNRFSTPPRKKVGF